MDGKSDSDSSDFEEDNLDCDPQVPWSDQHSACYICNGYYGPSFDDPVCGTCHAFLFPDLINQRVDRPILSEKTDDEDSGNDEPTDSLLEYRHFLRQFDHVVDDFKGPDLPADQPPQEEIPHYVEPLRSPPPVLVDPVPLPDLAQRLAMLSDPREPDTQCTMIQQLPPEVLLAIFGYLDDLSLCSAASVCMQWRLLLDTHVASTTWQHYTSIRWPLFHPIIDQNSWLKTYSALMSSCFCRTCLTQMALKSTPVGEQNYWRQNRLRIELKAMRSDPLEGIKAAPLDQECCHWQASITGPVGSPYEGGIFYLYVQVPFSYPITPPKVRFLTRIIHPNVSRHGDIGIDSIQHNWSLALTISKVLLSVQSLLTDPFTNICMEPSLGSMYQVNRKKFEQLARTWTWKFAMNDILQV